MLDIKADTNINPYLMGVKSSILLQPHTRNDLNKAIISFKQTVSVLGNNMSQTNEPRRIGAQQRKGVADMAVDMGIEHHEVKVDITGAEAGPTIEDVVTEHIVTTREAYPTLFRMKC